MTAHYAITEQELAARLVAGDEYAFTTVYLKHKKQIYGLIKKFIHSDDLVNDLTQEVFIKLWESRLKLSEVQSLKAYLFKIAKNHTLNNLKKALQSDVVMSEIMSRFYENKNNVEDQFQNREYEIYLDKILAELPERTREVFRQCRQQGRSYEEVAAELGISKNAIKKHMVNAMKHLGTSVKKDLNIPLTVFLALLLK